MLARFQHHLEGCLGKDLLLSPLRWLVELISFSYRILASLKTEMEQACFSYFDSLTRGKNWAFFWKDHLVRSGQSLLINQIQLTRNFDDTCKFLLFLSLHIGEKHFIGSAFIQREGVTQRCNLLGVTLVCVYTTMLWVKNVYIVGRKNNDQTSKSEWKEWEYMAIFENFALC